MEVRAPASELSAGDTLRASATVWGSSGEALTGQRVRWESSDTLVASVDATGLVRARSAGTATLRAVAGGKEGTLAVTVWPAVSELVISGAQEGRPGASLAVTVLVRGPDGRGVPGVRIEVVRLSGDAVVSPSSGTTDASGRFGATVTLGSTHGTSTFEVRAARTSASFEKATFAAVASPPQYTMTELGMIPAALASPRPLSLYGLHNLNNQGQVAAFALHSSTRTETRYVFGIWRNGSFTHVPNAFGLPAALNNLGQIVGVTPQGDPFIAATGTLTELGAVVYKGHPEAVNDKGTIVGHQFHRAFMLLGGTVQHLYPDSHSSYAVAVNARDHALVRVHLPPCPGCSPRIQSFLWREGQRTDLGTMEWPALNPGESLRDQQSSIAAVDVNDADQVVGAMRNDICSGSSCGSASRAFLWQNGVMRDLGTLPGYESAEVVAINNQGQILGSSYNRGGGPHSFFVWRNGQMYALSALAARSGWTLSSVHDINDRGQITARGEKNGVPGTRALLLTPE